MGKRKLQKFSLTISIFLILVFLIPGCSSEGKLGKLSDHSWKLETVTDSKGRPLENEVSLVFNTDNTFLLKDETEDRVWEGTYLSEKVDSSYKIEMVIESMEESVLAAYGMREYQDESKVPSFIFQLEDKIFSFLAED